MRPVHVFVTVVVALVLLYVSTSFQGITGMAPLSPQITINTAACGSSSGLGAGSGDVIELTADIATGAGNCFDLDIDDITFDCAGFTVNGSGTAAVGLNITGFNNTVTGCTVTNFTTAINIADNASVIRNNTLIGSSMLIEAPGSGIFLDIINNTFSVQSGAGTYFVDVDFFEDVVFENNSHVGGKNMRFQNGLDLIVRTNSLNGSVDIFGFSSEYTNPLIEGNTWVGDRDVAGSPAKVVDASTTQNLTFRNHANVTMQVSCTSCHNATYNNNTLFGNAELFVVGTNVRIEGNTWPTVALDSGQSGGIDYGSSLLFPGSGVVRNNVLANGKMLSLTVSANNTVVENNTIANVSGQGIVIEGKNITVRNNVITNLSGVAFRTSANDTKFLNNNVTFILKNANTSLNLNATTPQIPEGDVGFWLEENSAGANVSNNQIFVLNPLGLDVGVVGVHAESALHGYVGSNTFNSTLYDVFLDGATNFSVIDNTFTNARFKSIAVEAGGSHALRSNSITGGTIAPSIFLAGIELYRTANNVVDAETVSSYHMGVHLLNASNNNLTNITVTSGEFGVYSLFGTSNNLFNVSADATVSIGMRFVDSNSSTILNATISSPITGMDFHDSFFNTINISSISGAATGMEFNLFSANNSVNNNTFAGNTLDILFDMFATGNAGVGNGGPTTASENGAAGNAIS